MVSLLLQNLRLPAPNPYPITPPLRNLDGRGLMGQLPVDESLWQELDTLQDLNLANNKLAGLVPSEISQLSSLQYLSVAGNKLTGATQGLAALQDGGAGILRCAPCRHGGMPPTAGWSSRVAGRHEHLLLRYPCTACPQIVASASRLAP